MVANVLYPGVQERPRRAACGSRRRSSDAMQQLKDGDVQGVLVVPAGTQQRFRQDSGTDAAAVLLRQLEPGHGRPGDLHHGAGGHGGRRPAERHDSPSSASPQPGIKTHELQLPRLPGARRGGPRAHAERRLRRRRPHGVRQGEGRAAPPQGDADAAEQLRDLERARPARLGARPDGVDPGRGDAGLQGQDQRLAAQRGRAGRHRRRLLREPRVRHRRLLTGTSRWPRR